LPNFARWVFSLSAMCAAVSDGNLSFIAALAILRAGLPESRALNRAFTVVNE
jgi:hypothetical protein